MNNPANAKLRLLIIDDNLDDCEVFNDFFNLRPDIEICGIAMDGLEGIQKVRECNPDVVLTDFIMPNIDGAEVVKTIKRNSGDSIKVIVLSGISDTRIADEALRCGADYYLMKPISLLFLADKIISICSKNKFIKSNESRDLKCYINSYIRDLGIPIGLSGYDYIVRATNIMMETERVMTLKEINSIIADENSTSIQCVDACMHNAISKAHELHNQKYRDLLGDIEKCPGNYLFLRLVRESIRNIQMNELY